MTDRRSPLALVADDETDIRELVGRLLRRADFTVVQAGDGIDAWEKITTLRPDLIVLDLLMPQATGHAVTRWVRAHPQLCATPIIVLSAVPETPRRPPSPLTSWDLRRAKPFAGHDLLSDVSVLMRARNTPVGTQCPLERSVEGVQDQQPNSRTPMPRTTVRELNMSRILIAEDDPSIAETLLRRYSAAGHQVWNASDGLDALDQIQAIEPDVVVLDWMMPGLTGIELCEAIRQNPATADTHVIMVSALSQPDRIRRAYGAGVDQFVAKPFKVSQLLDGIDNGLEGHRPEPTRRPLSYTQALAGAKSGHAGGSDAGDPGRPADAGQAVVCDGYSAVRSEIARVLIDAGMVVAAETGTGPDLARATAEHMPGLVVLGDALGAHSTGILEAVARVSPATRIILYMRYGQRSEFGSLPSNVVFVPRGDIAELRAAVAGPLTSV